MENGKTVLYLVRHAKSIANEKRLYSSRAETDEGLSEFGKEQAREVAEFFKSKEISKIYSSPFRRTIQTAEMIAKATNQNKINEVEELKELNCGDWEGHTETEIEKKFPEAWKGWHVDPQNNPIPKGESLIEVQARALPVLNKIIKENRGKEIIVVTHYCVFNTLLCSLISGLGNFRCFDTSNGTVARIIVENVPRLNVYQPGKR